MAWAITTQICSKCKIIQITRSICGLLHNWCCLCWFADSSSIRTNQFHIDLIWGCIWTYIDLAWCSLPGRRRIHCFGGNSAQGILWHGSHLVRSSKLLRAHFLFGKIGVPGIVWHVLGLRRSSPAAARDLCFAKKCVPSEWWEWLTKKFHHFSYSGGPSTEDSRKEFKFNKGVGFGYSQSSIQSINSQ